MLTAFRHVISALSLFVLSLSAFSAFADDFYENNDTYTTAYFLSNGIWLSSLSGSGVSDDQDWYRIVVSSSYQNAAVSIQLQFPGTTADLDLELYDSTGTNRIDFSWFGVNQESVEATLTPGTYYILVDTWTGGGDPYIGAVYDLRWDITATNVDDAYEENDYWISTVDLPANTLLSDINGPGIAWDQDWYRITVTSSATRVNATLQHTHAEGDLDLVLADVSGNTLAMSDGTVDNENINFDVGAAGTYFLAVYDGAGGAYSGQAYDLSWFATSAVTAGDDVYEENDIYTSAFPLIQGQALSDSGGLGIAADDDWYQITVPAGAQLNIDLTFAHAEGDLDMELYGSDGTTVIGGSYSTSDNETIMYDVDAASTFFLYVYSYESSTQAQTYDLEYTISNQTGVDSITTDSNKGLKGDTGSTTTTSSDGGGGSLGFPVLLLLAVAAVLRSMIRGRACHS